MGNLTTLTVQLRDSFGNLITTSGGAIIAASIGAGPNAGTTLTIVDVGDGTYTISYTAASGPGDDFVDITLSGVAISGSPYTNSIQ